MPRVRVAAVQASYVLMHQQATLDKVAELTVKAAAQGAQFVVFPEVFVPGTPICIDTRPIWDGDEEWFRLLAQNAVVVPGPATERLAGLAREHKLWLVIGAEARWDWECCRSAGRPGWRPIPRQRAVLPGVAGGDRRGPAADDQLIRLFREFCDPVTLGAR
jgi:Carbon-nitrogen hydrolase